MTPKTLLGGTAAVALALPAAAEPKVGMTPGEADRASVVEAIGAFGCEASTVEKEAEGLFEVDDARCGETQYDIRLDGDFTVIAMTHDGPVDGDSMTRGAAPGEIEEIAELLQTVGCEVEAVERESDFLYEIDDAACGLGQFDIKLDNDLTLLSMVHDGPIDEPMIGPSEEIVAEILDKLGSMDCEMEPADIAVVDGRYELDDVYCIEGQFDMVLDQSYEIVEQTKE